MCAESLISVLEQDQARSRTRPLQATPMLAHDFDVAKGLVIAGLRQKLDYWNRVPWVLCGTAHWDPVIQSKCAEAAVAAIEQDHTAALHSRLTRRWMYGRVWEDLGRLASGDAWQSLSVEFRMASAALFFVPVDECPAEEKHAKATKASKATSRLSSVGMSLSNRYPVL